MGLEQTRVDENADSWGDGTVGDRGGVKNTGAGQEGRIGRVQKSKEHSTRHPLASC